MTTATHETKKTLSGVIGPMTTTFDATTGDLSLDGLRTNVRGHLASGLSGVLIAGSTGEAPLLDDRERDQLVTWTRDLVPRDRWLMVGVGAESTRQTIARARAAAERGADAVLVVAPHYYGPAMTADALREHYVRVADASPIPVLLYTIPQYMHFALAPDLVAGLATHPNIVGMKDSSGDLSLLAGYLAAQGPAFTVLTGNGSTFATAREMGASGGILAVGLFAARLAVEIDTACAVGDYARAALAQERLRPLSSEIVGAHGVAGVKAALDHIGLAGGATRPPLLALRAADRQRVASLLDAAGLARAA